MKPAFAAAQVPRPYRCPTRERGIETIKLWLTFGKTRAVIRPRVRGSVIRVRIDETAIRIRIVARTTDHAPTGLSTVPREPSILAAPAQTQPNSGRRTPQRISFVVHRYFVISLFRFTLLRQCRSRCQTLHNRQDARRYPSTSSRKR